ncbi:phosphotransferase [Paenibacillus glucanolyticus]|uniref:phosphotransferase n=1 Tax=Paenibacillus glucanolyticus TaxID=59843 RepID=UPI0036C9AD0E
MGWTCHLDQADLQEYVEKVLGTGYVVAEVTRMHGGAQKVVYKIHCDNGFVCVLYVWDLTMNYFQEEIANEHDVHERSFGAHSFEMNNSWLREHGILTPALYDLHVHTKQSRYPFDYALVEYIEGQKAEAYVQHPDQRVQDEVLERLGDMIAGMHAHQRQIYGKSDPSEGRRQEPCYLMQLDNAKKQLSYVVLHHAAIRDHHDRLIAILNELESRIDSRKRYGYIHGELGPDHVLVTERFEPYLIDIEGAQFFDTEHEHTFLELRFGESYRYFRPTGLDPNRMLFYRLHHYISLTSGGLKLLHRGFPDRAFARSLADYHARNTLRFIEEWR